MPFGSGKELGRGRGRGMGRGHGGYGPSGYCICLKCGTKVPHQRGVPCTEMKCPNCGHIMAREEMWQERSED